MTERLQLHDSNLVIIKKMCGTNFGAIKLVTRLLKMNEVGIEMLLYLDSWGLHESDLWTAYDICGLDFDKFIYAIRSTAQGICDLKAAVAEMNRADPGPVTGRVVEVINNQDVYPLDHSESL